MKRASFVSNVAGLAAAPLSIPEWTRTPGGAVQSYGAPSASARVARAVSRSGMLAYSPLGQQYGSTTPNGLFYVVNHGGVPQVDASAHRLVVHGLVGRPMVFSVDQIRRFPPVTRSHFLECSGNTGSEWSAPKANSVLKSHGLLSCGQWTGARLIDILNEAGIHPEARWFVAEGADSVALDRSIPLVKALDDALVVYAQNGEPLRPEQGYPLRLLLPGFEGNTNIKWLRRIKLVRGPVFSQQETSDYTDLMPDGKARAFTFVMEAKSVIVRPSPGFSLTERGTQIISGLAWSGRGRIARVQVSFDGGKAWQDAAMDEPVLPKCLTSFHLPFAWQGEEMLLQSRATDETGYVQPSLAQLVAARGTRSFFHNNSIQTWHLRTSGELNNVHV